MVFVTPRRLLAATLVTVTLTACGGGTSDAPETPKPLVHGAIEALSWSMHLLLRGGPLGARPSSLLGVYVSSFVAQTRGVPYASAFNGIEAQMQMLFGSEDPRDTYALLQELGLALQVDIADILNRSTDRPKTLDAYLLGLEGLTAEAKKAVDKLERDEDELATDRGEKRKRMAEIQSSLNRALREEDYATAGRHQEELTQARAVVAEVEAKQKEASSTKNIFEDMLDVAEERFSAIQENREVLIAGLKVVKVPGIDNLGVLLEKSRYGRNTGSDLDASRIFDPDSL